jgi:hypothetical protein
MEKMTSKQALIFFSLLYLFCLMSLVSLSSCAHTNDITKNNNNYFDLDKIPPRIKEDINEDNDWAIAVNSASDCTDKEGILISDEKAILLAKYKVGYDELYDCYELDAKLCNKKITECNNALNKSEKEIKKLQPNWFRKNKGMLGFVGGLLVGAGCTVGIVYASN